MELFGADNRPKPRVLRARAELAECDTELTRHRAALKAGADPATVTQWIAEANAELAAAKAEPRGTYASQAHPAMSAEDLNSLITTLGGLVAVLHGVKPEDRHNVYDQLGIRLTLRMPKISSVQVKRRVRTR